MITGRPDIEAAVKERSYPLMKRIFLATASLAAVATIALPALAGPRGGGHGPGMMKERMEAMDTDGDGNVTQAEVDVHRAMMFSAIDVDQDGKVSEAEMTAHHEAMMAQKKAQRQAEMFKRMDADGDGVISAEEFASKPNRMFDRFDKDGDGVIAIDEIPDRKAGFRGKRGDVPPPPPPEDE